MVLSLVACGSSEVKEAAEEVKSEAEEVVSEVKEAAEEAGEKIEEAAEEVKEEVSEAAEEVKEEVTGTKEFTIGICNYGDDASLNQIVANIEAELEAYGEANNVVFNIKSENCNADSSVLQQIISDFIFDGVDLMVGVATPVAMAMQSQTDEIPIVFAAVSDPVGAGLVESLEAPGANITGSSDYLDTAAVMDLIIAQNPDIEKVALLYDKSQDSSTTAIAAAKEYLDSKNIAYKEYNGTLTDEVKQAVAQMVSDGIVAAFTPSDNTIMTAELSIYEDMAKAGIQHYAGADSFALNGAFVGYGVDYAELGVQTGDMIADILVNGKDPAETPVLTFDNGTATVNTEICDALGFDYDTVAETFAPFCTKVQPIETAESFEDVE